MTLRLCLILIFLIHRGLLYSSDSASVRTESCRTEKYISRGNKKLFFECNHFKALPFIVKDTISLRAKEKSFIKRTSNGKKWLSAAYIPAGMITAGLITMAVPENTILSKYTIQDKITDNYPDYSTKFDNYLQFTPGVAVFGLKAIGLKSRNDLLNQSIILTKSQLLTMVIVQSLKTVTHVERPNGSSYHSMPSGHTAQAFQLATMLDMEYRDVSPWISVSGYTVASATGVLRMLNNRHWISDVLVGAGIGIFTTKFVYLTHQCRWGKNSKIAFLPVISNNGGGIVFAIQL